MKEFRLNTGIIVIGQKKRTFDCDLNQLAQLVHVFLNLFPG